MVSTRTFRSYKRSVIARLMLPSHTTARTTGFVTKANARALRRSCSRWRANKAREKRWKKQQKATLSQLSGDSIYNHPDVLRDVTRILEDRWYRRFSGPDVVDNPWERQPRGLD